MTSFDGFLESWQHRNSRLELRFIAGGLEPWTEEAPVLHALVESPDNLTAIVEELGYLQGREDNVYVECLSVTQLVLRPDHSDPVNIIGRSVSTHGAAYKFADYQRVIGLHFGRVNDLDTSLAAVSERAKLVRLARWYAQEVEAKLKRGKLEDTECAALEQQLGFAGRIIDALKA
ncbi:MAG: hypothetical protein ACRES7_06010 [Gammaproteobacteria bacterium]